MYDKMLFIDENQVVFAACKTVHKSSTVVRTNVHKYQLFTQLYTNVVPVYNGARLVYKLLLLFRFYRCVRYIQIVQLYIDGHHTCQPPLSLLRFHSVSFH